jgi:hypothetical protein
MSNSNDIPTSASSNVSDPIQSTDAADSGIPKSNETSKSNEDNTPKVVNAAMNTFDAVVGRFAKISKYIERDIFKSWKSFLAHLIGLIFFCSLGYGVYNVFENWNAINQNINIDTNNDDDDGLHRRNR